MRAEERNETPELLALEQSFDLLRKAAANDPFPSAERRRALLSAVERAIIRRKDAIVAAVDADFHGRMRAETLIAEVYVTLEAFRFSRQRVKGWMRKRRRHVPATLGFGSAWVQPHPVGVVGIIAPWNYPFMLAMTPVAGALAAGNRVLLKPSELTPRTTALIAEIIAEALTADMGAVVSGGPDIGERFSSLPLDHLLFTGSTRVGRKVMSAAAANLTPVTLELGGKSPALVLPGADLDSAALDIAFGKFTNAGQTCVAPDYVLLPRAEMPRFTAAMEKAVASYFPSTPDGIAMSSVFGEGGLRRQQAMLEEARASGAVTYALGAPLPGTLLAPTLVVDPAEHLAVMREEIFGPLLPVIPYDDVDMALRYIGTHDRPLALYLFGRDQTLIDRALERTLSGGAVVNDTLIHLAIEDLPFGGTGPSGMGRYHGREGFDAFSHLRAVFHRRGPRLDRMMRPPLRALHERIARFLIGG